MEPFLGFKYSNPCRGQLQFSWESFRVASNRVFATEVSAEIHSGPLQGLQGVVLATNPQGQVLFRPGNLPGVAVLLSATLVREQNANAPR